MHKSTLAFLAVAVLLLAVATFFAVRPPAPSAKPVAPIAQAAPQTPPPLSYVGGRQCASCHAEQARRWQGSNHDLAMQVAEAKTVLGDFNHAQFRKGGVESRFYQRDGRFWVETDGPDGKLAEFEVKYTFGVSPLQQYLVELPGGRLQALSIAWDSRPKAAGGQRWFHLYPSEAIDHNDELHWTKLSQNWNYMCAECHSTDLKKNYDPASRRYQTTWSEIDVSCEACHGPGSRHVAWAQGKNRPAQDKGLAVVLDERRGAVWAADAATGQLKRSPARTSDKEIQVCARCHARRGQWFDYDKPGQALLDSHLPSLLREAMYQADGQIDGEVYEYGSFLQSKMNHAGVTCSDCHEPHSLKLRAEGGAVCLQCHGAERYASRKHHFHAGGEHAPNCLDCHMATRTYMVVDPRHDHSFRVPRPDQSARLGTPNACQQCHQDKSARWAAEKLRAWLGRDPQGYQNYAEALQAARTNAADAGQKLAGVVQDLNQPGIARATAAAELRWRLSEATFPVIAESLGDPDPLVRIGALEALDAVPLEQRWQIAHPLLHDPLRVVRTLAAEALAGVAKANLPAPIQAQWQRAGQDYIDSQRLNADQPSALVNLGNFQVAEGQPGAAEQSYREALSLDPNWVPAYVNLGDLYRRMGRDGEGEGVLKAGLALQPKAAALHHSLGLWQVRRKDLAAALDSLRLAVELAPGDTHFRYVYALALQSAGRDLAARKVVEAGLKRAPGDAALKALSQQWPSKAPK